MHSTFFETDSVFNWCTVLITLSITYLLENSVFWRAFSIVYVSTWKRGHVTTHPFKLIEMTKVEYERWESTSHFRPSHSGNWLQNRISRACHHENHDFCALSGWRDHQRGYSPFLLQLFSFWIYDNDCYDGSKLWNDSFHFNLKKYVGKKFQESLQFYIGCLLPPIHKIHI